MGILAVAAILLAWRDSRTQITLFELRRGEGSLGFQQDSVGMTFYFSHVDGAAPSSMFFWHRLERSKKRPPPPLFPKAFALINQGDAAIYGRGVALAHWTAGSVVLLVWTVMILLRFRRLRRATDPLPPDKE